MERETNQLEAGNNLCRTGCGFFGSSNTDGLCSQCYKDALKKKQQPPSTLPSTSPSSVATVNTSTSTSIPTLPSISNTQSSIAAEEEKVDDSQLAEAPCQDTDPSSATSSENESGGKKKKNKCHMCKKKVGLTGFTCRCGGLFCSVHRYSNEHRCTFDYRELGAEEIRKNNPVVKGEKIQKI